MYIHDKVVSDIFSKDLSSGDRKELIKLIRKGIPRYLMYRTRCSYEDAEDITSKTFEKFYAAALDNIEKRNAAYFKAVLESAIATLLGKKHRKAEVPLFMDPGNDIDDDKFQPGVMKIFMDMSNEERNINDIVFDMRIIGEKLVESAKKTGDPEVLCICEVIVMVGNNHPTDDFKKIKHDTREIIGERTCWDEKRIRNAMLRASRSKHFRAYQVQREQLRRVTPEQGTGD